jgi:hypothetical protein
MRMCANVNDNNYGTDRRLTFSLFNLCLNLRKKKSLNDMLLNGASPLK